MDPEINMANEKTHLLKEGQKHNGKWWTTFKFILASGAGLFADGWDLQVINIMLAILEHSYPQSMTPTKVSLTASMTFIGVIVGQIMFGVLGDLLGRKWCSIATSILTIAGTIASACVTDNGYFTIGSRLAVCRFFAGVGIGGEYPVSAAIAKEMGNDLCFTKLTLLQINELMYSLGCIAQSVFCFILVAAHADLEATWRLGCAVGVLPSLVGLFLRLYLEETETPHPRGARLSSYAASGLSLTGSHLFILVGCSSSWALFNFASYGETAFSHLIADDLLGSSDESGADIYLSLWRSCIFAVILSCLSCAGNAFGFVLLNYLSTKKTQCIGFFIMTVSIWLCCLVHRIHWLSTLFFFLNFMQNGLLGMTCYLMPTLCFPKALRASAVGIAAGVGKAGAAIGTAIFPIIDENAGFVWAIFICGAVGLFGMLVTITTPFVEAST